MGRGFVWNPAGADRRLAQAVTELRAGRAGLAREILAASREEGKGNGDFTVRAHRSLILGSAAAGTDAAELWIEQQPQDPDARLLYARVAMVRALRAEAAGDPRAAGLGALAWRAGAAATEFEPGDPTPWAVLLAVARCRPERDADLEAAGAAAPAVLCAAGPWDLLAEAQARQPWHREAFRRLLTYFFPRRGGEADTLWQVASWAADTSPGDTDPQLLPLAARAELERSGAGQPESAEEYAAYIAANLYADWLPGVRQLRFPPVADLSLLAHALDRAGRIVETAVVLERLRPYAAAFPWSLDGDPRSALLDAYARSHVRPP